MQPLVRSSTLSSSSTIVFVRNMLQQMYREYHSAGNAHARTNSVALVAVPVEQKENQ